MADTPQSPTLDTNSIIDSLVKLQSAPLDVLQKRQSGLKSQISLLGNLTSKLSALESAAKGLASGGVLTLKATSTNGAFTTLTLKQQGGAAEDLVLESDADGTRARLQTFVDAYNAVMKLAQQETRPTAETDRATTFTGESRVRMLAARLQSVVSTRFRETGSLRTLADLGVKADPTTGQLTLDGAALGVGVARDPSAVNALFSTASTGVAAVTSSLVQGFTRCGDGLLTSRSASLQGLSKKMDDDLVRLQARVDAYRDNLVKQFAAMEDAVGNLKSAGSFLTAQDSLASTGDEGARGRARVRAHRRGVPRGRGAARDRAAGARRGCAAAGGALMASVDGRGAARPPTTSAGRLLLSALGAAEHAFAAGDPFGASAALDAVVAACAELERAGGRLDPAMLAHAKALHGACTAASLPLHDDLKARMEHAAGARRAATAYAR